MHPRLEKIKTHVQQHKTKYLVAGGVIVGAVIGGTVVYFKTKGFSVDGSVNVVQGIAVNSPVTVNNVTTVIDRALGDSGDVIRNIDTGEIFRSRGELSRITGFSMSAIGKYFKSEIPDLGGMQYEILDKAERLVR